MMNDFEDYWKNFGRYHNEVIKNSELEEDFKTFAFKTFKVAYRAGRDYEHSLISERHPNYDRDGVKERYD